MHDLFATSSRCNGSASESGKNAIYKVLLYRMCKKFKN